MSLQQAVHPGRVSNEALASTPLTSTLKDPCCTMLWGVPLLFLAHVTRLQPQIDSTQAS
jgi:hypothetical protein